MKFCITGRRAGKSTRLAAWARESPENIVVVCNLDMAKNFSRRFKIPMLQITTYRQLMNKAGCDDGYKFAIDDGEQFIQHLFGRNKVEFFMATGEIEILPRPQDSLPYSVIA
jgi:hypothetical protein